jgi:hypothetical protein
MTEVDRWLQYPGLINDVAAVTQLPPAEGATRILVGADAVSDEGLETLPGARARSLGNPVPLARWWSAEPVAALADDVGAPASDGNR